MKTLLEVKLHDRAYYEERLKDFLPDRIIDVHTHVWLTAFRVNNPPARRSVTWTSRVAEDNSIEDLLETYRLLLPGKEVTPVIFGSPSFKYDVEKCNAYVKECAIKYGFPSLMLAYPAMSAAELEEKLLACGYKGIKVYLEYAPAYLPSEEIRIFDFLPHHQLEVLEKHGMAVMLHIARPGRLRDRVNIAQMMEIDERYPNVKLIIAHIGRAYADADVGDAFETLSKSKHMLFDFCANTNAIAMRSVLEAVGPKRVMFGTDMPILRMRTRRIVENNTYINLVPKGLYGDVSGDIHMRDVEGAEADSITFFMYEELNSFKVAAGEVGLTRSDLEDVFFGNAARLFGVK